MWSGGEGEGGDTRTARAMHWIAHDTVALVYVNVYGILYDNAYRFSVNISTFLSFRETRAHARPCVL